MKHKKSVEVTAEMQTLSSLSFAHSDLEALPVELLTMTRLVSLDLSCNALVRLSHLPVTLVELNLSENGLTVLPDDFARLQCLRKIRLSKNRFRAWPAVLGQMRSLENLTLFRNEITELPAVADVSSHPARVKVRWCSEERFRLISLSLVARSVR
jgi:Leucine-rich repeat (LRR) protein